MKSELGLRPLTIPGGVASQFADVGGHGQKAYFWLGIQLLATVSSILI